MLQLGFLGNGFAVPIGTFWVSDKVACRFEFERFSILAKPIRDRAVYMMVRSAPGNFYVDYVGIAEDLSKRLADHERLTEAINRGCNELWSHVPGAEATFPFREVERRLITAYDPPMNVQHRSPLASMFLTLGSQGR